MHLKLAWRNLWRNRRRTLITSGSVFFAVLLAIFIKSLKEGVYDRMIDNMVTVYTGVAQIHQNGYWKEQLLDNSFKPTDSLYHILEKNRYITGFTPRVESFVLASSNVLTKGAMLVGVDPENEDALTSLKSRMISGNYFRADDKSAIIGDRLASFLDLEIGDTLVVIGQGLHGSMAAGKYPVAGLVKFGSPELRKSIIYLPVAEADWLFNMNGRLTSLVLGMDDIGRAARVTDDLQQKLGADYEVMPWQKLLPELEQTIEWDRWEGYIFTAILYIIITFGIFGTLLMMMSERQHEFGVLVAVGMKRVSIAVILVMEVVIVSLIGAVAGMIVMFPVSLWFHHNPIYVGEDMGAIYEEYGFEAVLQSSYDPYIFYNQALAIVLLTFIAAFIPLMRVLRMNPLEAMNS